jgi:hypothetical protein
MTSFSKLLAWLVPLALLTLFAAPARASEDAASDEPGYAGPATTMRVALQLTKLTRFEPGPGTYNVEFYVTFTCDHEPCKPDFDVTNGKLTAKPEKELDEKLRKQFRVKAELDAFVDMSDYPFDSHVLPIAFVDKNAHDVKYEVLEQASVIEPQVKLPGWEIAPKLAAHVAHHRLEDGSQVSEAQFAVAIQRPTLTSFCKSLMPLFFLLFVAGFTLLLKPKAAAGRLAAGTVGLTAAVAFHLGQINSLPPLGYLTRMDKFMLASYVVYVLSIAFSVAMVRFEERKNEKASELTYLIAGGAVPGVALIAWMMVILKIA